MDEGSESKKIAILRILQVLEKYSDCKHPLTQKDIKAKLSKVYDMELERKAISRDLILLQDMLDKDSMSLNPSCAVTMEINKRKGSYISKRLFEDSEIRLLIDSVLSSKYISEKHSSDLIEKLCLLSNEYFRMHVKHISMVKDWGKLDDNTLFDNIDVIDVAIEKHRKIKFDYNKYGVDKKLHKTSEWVASPYQLIIHNQRYYLMFHSDKWDKISYLRLDRITNVRVLEESALPLRTIKGYESGVDYKKFSQSLPYMFTDEIENITFIANEGIVDQIIDWFGYNVNIQALGDKKVKVSMYASPNAMEYWAMQYLNYVEIITPKALREKIKSNLNSAIEKYQ